MQDILAQLLAGRALSRQQAEHAFREVLSGNANESQVGAMLALLQVKGATVDELVGAASIMRAYCTPVPLNPAIANELRRGLVDTCGTGGTAKTFNVSTAAAVVAAAAGERLAKQSACTVRVRVAKHGGRSRSGRGSAEVLTALGVNIDATPTVQAHCLERVGVCFSFAVNHHPAMRFAAGPRKSLGFPTIFNLLGPLCNPAGASRQLMGVYDHTKQMLITEALRELGTQEAMIVHGLDGMDEITTTAPTEIVHLRDGAITTSRIDARDLGVPRATIEQLTVESLDKAAAMFRAILAGERGAPREIVAVNAGAALVVGGGVNDLASGLAAAREAIDSGDAARTLESLARASHEEHH